jgi:hypothetical protein
MEFAYFHRLALSIGSCLVLGVNRADRHYHNKQEHDDLSHNFFSFSDAEQYIE